MITEIVTFKLPEGMTHDDVVANFEKTAPNWGPIRILSLIHISEPTRPY